MKKFELDDSNILLKEYYEKENIKEVMINSKIKTCYIFFSSNGLYFPNTEKVFRENIIEKDRYEWLYFSGKEEIKDRAGKYIFVRDVYKAWYVTGVNNKIDTIDKLTDELRVRTKGYEIITVGNSAGGYMVALVGTLLNAKMVFDFSGQFSLYEHDLVVEKNYFLKKYSKDNLKNTYYDITPLLESKVPIFYFYPAHCEQDIIQSNLVKKISNIYTFAFGNNKHGDTVYPGNIPVLLTLGYDSMIKLHKIYNDKIINRNLFMIKTMGFKSLCNEYMTALVRKMKKLSKYEIVKKIWKDMV